MEATKLYFPDYSLPWIVRCDASEFAVGAILFQVRPIDPAAKAQRAKDQEANAHESTDYLKSANQKKPTEAELNDVIYEPIAFSGQRFSEPATRWDTYKREAFAMFHAISSFQWYLRGKKFTLETDHRNLQWIESSDSPIVIRWRALMQSFDFIVRHIPGRLNRVADWLLVLS